MLKLETFQVYQSIALEGKHPKDKSLHSISYFAHRAISTRISWLIYRHAHKITPNMVTSAAIVLTITGSLILMIGDRNSITLGIAAGMLYLSFLADKVDGEIARAKGVAGGVKPYLDDMYHALQPLSILGLSVFLAGLDMRLVLVGFFGSYSLFLRRHKKVLRRQREWVEVLQDRGNDSPYRSSATDSNQNRRSLASKIARFVLRFDTLIAGLVVGCVLPNAWRDTFLSFLLLFISITVTLMMSKALLFDIWRGVKQVAEDGL